MFITPGGSRAARTACARAFAKLLGDVPSAEWDVPTQIFEGDLLFIEWSADAGRRRVEDGIDTFMFRDGEIVAQTVRYTLQQK